MSSLSILTDFFNFVRNQFSEFFYNKDQDFLNKVSSLLEDDSLWQSKTPNLITIKSLHDLFINATPIQLLACRSFISQKIRLNFYNSNFQLSSDHISSANHIAKNGFVLGFLDLDFDSINQRIYSLRGKVSHSPSAGGELSFFNKSLKRFAVGGETSLFYVPELFDIFNNDWIIGTVISYLGCQPTIVEVATVYTSESVDNLHAQELHRDINDFGWITVFVYHDDINSTNGPHLFITGSHKLEEYPNCKSGVPKFTFFYGNDNQYLNHFGEPVEIVGPRGTIIIEDSIGLHAGKRVQKGSRMVSWCVYALTPSLFNFYNNTNKSTLNWSDLNLSPSNIDRYRWRLFID